ncbi:MAG: SAF domain-containing protein [Ilumatobacteraceae bacterium]
MTASRRGAVPAAASERASRSSGFRPSSRSRLRIAAGALLAAVAVGVMLLIFATADKRIAVLQLIHDVPAGQQLAADDVRTIEVSADPTLAIVHAGNLDVVVGRYAKVRMTSGALLTEPMLQSAPLVAPGSAVVAVTIPSGELPVGLRERSQIQLVFPPTGSAADVPPVPVTGRVVGLPTAPDSVTGKLSLSVEMAAADAVTVAAAAEVRVVLLDPGVDPASATTDAGDGGDGSTATTGVGG